jgi:uncharacterized protein DUF6600/FecR-like protein
LQLAKRHHLQRYLAKQAWSLRKNRINQMQGALMTNVKVWPHLIIVAVVCAVAAGVGVGLWMKYERTASAAAVPNAARIERVEGDVALNNGLDSGDNNQANQWYAAAANQPFSVGDRIYTRDNSRASLAFTGRNFARLNPNTSIDVLALDDRRTQLALRDGSAVFDVGYLQPADLFEVATPYGAVDFQQPGLYNVGIDNGRVLVSVLSGLAQVVGLGGSGQVSKGELLALAGQTAADVALSQLDNRDAGYLVDDYYSYQYPHYYDGRYRDYNAYLSNPTYYDPYRRYVSYQYVNSYIPGLSDLDYYGDWQNVSGYGYAWAPRVDAGWVPYQSGYWVNDYPYGPTWVSNEPWGYAPYHYGRWAFANDRWYWVPDAVNTTPAYSPALVAFVPFANNDIGWVPLGPGDVYVPHYYTSNWQPNYLTRDNLYQRVVNLNVPNAVTVINADDFTRGDDWRRARRADRNMLAQVNPVLDPLLLTPLRNAVLHSAWGRGKKDIPPGIAKKLQDTTVITSTAVASPPFRRDLARAMRVEEVSDRARGQKFKVRDERQGRGAPQAATAPPAETGPPTDRGRPAERGRPADAGRSAENGSSDRGRPAENGSSERGRSAQNGPPAARGRAAERGRPAQTGPPAERGRPEQQRPVASGPPAQAEQPQRGRGAQRQQPTQPAPAQRARVEQRGGPPARQSRPEQQRPQAERVARPAQQTPQAERVARPAAQPKQEQPHGQQKQQGPPQKQQGPPNAAPAKGGNGKGKGKKP